MTPLRIIIVGGGFGGVAAARALERDHVVTLVAQDNFLLFTPMLAEVAAGDVEPRHIVSPLRQLCPRSRVIVAEVDAIEPPRVTVRVGGRALELPAEVLVVAGGSVVQTFSTPGADEWTLPFKTIGDALRIRRRLISLLEQASARPRESLTTIAIVGAGFSGAELAAALGDFMRKVGPKFYPEAPRPRILLIDAVPRVVAALPEALSAAAAEALQQRGVELLLGRAVVAVDGQGVLLDGGQRVTASTVVWTAGIGPAPLAATTGLPRDEQGRVVVDEHLRAAPGVYALGDIARVPDGFGGISEPTAQFALRQGRYLGKRLAALQSGRRTPPFRYRSRGQLVSLGHRNAVGLVFGRQVSGFLAWWMWRSYYLFQLPTLLRKVRVALDWSIDLLFPPDIAGIPSGDTGPPINGPEDQPGSV